MASKLVGRASPSHVNLDMDQPRVRRGKRRPNSNDRRNLEDTTYAWSFYPIGGMLSRQALRSAVVGFSSLGRVTMGSLDTRSFGFTLGPEYGVHKIRSPNHEFKMDQMPRWPLVACCSSPRGEPFVSQGG